MRTRAGLIDLPVVFALAAFACSGGGGGFGHPKITEEQIGNDMVGWRRGDGHLVMCSASKEHITKICVFEGFFYRVPFTMMGR